MPSISASPAKIGPTPETLAKLTPDPLRLLYTRGLLDADPIRNRMLYDAGGDIERAYRLITAPVAAAASNYGRPRGAGGDTAEWTDGQVALVRRYDAWAAAMRRKRLPLGPVFDIVVEGLSCREVDRAWGRRDKWAVGILRRALALWGQGLRRAATTW